MPWWKVPNTLIRSRWKKMSIRLRIIERIRIRRKMTLMLLRRALCFIYVIDMIWPSEFFSFKLKLLYSFLTTFFIWFKSRYFRKHLSVSKWFIEIKSYSILINGIFFLLPPQLASRLSFPLQTLPSQKIYTIKLKKNNMLNFLNRKFSALT